MSSVAASISTLLVNINSASNFVNTLAYDITQAAIAEANKGGDDPTTTLDDPPAVRVLTDFPGMPAPDELVDSAKEIQGYVGAMLDTGVPDLSTLLSSIKQVDLTDQYLGEVEPYRAFILERIEQIQIPEARQYGVSGYIRQQIDLSPSTFADVSIPDFARAAFEQQTRRRIQLEGDKVYWVTRNEETLINTRIQVSIDDLAAQKQLQIISASLDFANASLSGTLALIKKQILSPEAVADLYRKLTSARTNLARLYADSTGTEVDVRMRYLNTLNGYYNLAEKTIKRSWNLDLAVEERDSEKRMSQIRALMGNASASTASASAAYSAIRAGFALAEKTFQ